MENFSINTEKHNNEKLRGRFALGKDLSIIVLSMASKGKYAREISRELQQDEHYASILGLIKQTGNYVDGRSIANKGIHVFHDEIDNIIQEGKAPTLKELSNIGNEISKEGVRLYLIRRGLYEKWKSNKAEKRKEMEKEKINKVVLAEEEKKSKFREYLRKFEEDKYALEILKKRAIYNFKSNKFCYEDLKFASELLREFDRRKERGEKLIYTQIAKVFPERDYNDILRILHRTGRGKIIHRNRR